MVDKTSKVEARPISATAAVARPPVSRKPLAAPQPLANAAPNTAAASEDAATTTTKLEAATDSAIIEGSIAMNDTVTSAQDATQTFTADAGEKMQALFGGASERAKGAYERGLKMTEELTEFQKGNVEAFVESGKLVAKGAESLGQEAADYARKSFESSTAAFKTFASAKSPTELFKLQSDYMKSSFESAIAESSKVTEAWLKLAGDVVQPLSNRLAVAAEKVKATAAF